MTKECELYVKCGFVKKYHFKYYKNLKSKDDTIDIEERATDSQ